MKKIVFAAAILSTLLAGVAEAGPLNSISAAAGSARDDSFDYAGFSMGINSRTDVTGITSTAGPQYTTNANKDSTQVNGTLTVGEGRRLTDAQALAGELQVVGLNGHLMPAAQAVYFTSMSDQDLNHVPVLLALHSGVGARMGLTTGVDLVFPLTTLPTSSIRTGFTLFQRSVDGAHGLFNVGLFTSF